MTWFRVDDGFADHPKVDALADGRCSDAALALWLLAGSWCAKHLTDGAVPTGRASRLGVSKWKKAAQELVRVGLWIETEDGWNFNDWLEYQPSKEAVLADREKTAERVKRHRNRAKAPISKAACNGVTNPVSNDAPVPSRPDPSLTLSNESVARAPVDIVKRVYARRYEAKWRDAFLGFDSAHRQLQAIATWAAEQADGPEAAMHRLLDGADRQERLERARWPLRWLAEDPSGHAAYVGKTSSRAASPLSAWDNEPEVA